MRTIFKYPIHLVDSVQTIEIPVLSKFLYFSEQGTHKLFAWFEVNSDHPTKQRFFKVFGTGHKLPEEKGKASWLGTCQDGPFVWHLYELEQV